MSALRAWVVLTAAVACAGCGVQLGASAGAALGGGRRAAVRWSSGLGVQYVPLGEHGAFGGLEVEGRGEGREGSLFTLGAQAGYQWNPRARSGAIGWQLHLDVGAPFRDLSLAPGGELYFGGAADLLIWLAPNHENEEINDAFWLLNRSAVLVIELRERTYREHFEGPALLRHDVSLGLAVRGNLATDLL